MSERMKPEDRLHGVTPVALRQHQTRGCEALRLEMAWTGSRTVWRCRSKYLAISVVLTGCFS